MSKGLRTRLAHSGGNEAAKKTARSVSIPKVMPIYMSSVFSFDDVESLDGVYEGRESGYIYSRMANPGVENLQELLSSAENSDGAIAFGSGMAAIITAVLSNVGKGDHIIASPVLYGGVYDYLKNEITRFGVEVDFVDFINDDIEKYIKPNTKVLYTETITNPLMEVMDIPKISLIAHKHGAKLIVDNTFASPAVCRPLEHGADIAAYSGTKYLSGHSDLLCGALCADKQNITELQKSIILYGGIISPFDAWLLTRSLRTLELRMRQHSENAQKLAEYFENHPKIERVYYPGLKSSEFHTLAMRLFDNGLCGGMLSADIAGGESAASAFIAACEDVKLVPSLAGVATSVSYPAKTSHRAYTKEELDKCGISTGQLRFSAGIENIEDIIADIDRALAKI
jgi:methionine-gamma-lyase